MRERWDQMSISEAGLKGLALEPGGCGQGLGDGAEAMPGLERRYEVKSAGLGDCVWWRPTGKSASRFPPGQLGG